MQLITLTGRVGNDAETRQAGQNEVTNFNLAVDQGWGQDKTTNWYRIALWGGRGKKLAEYIKKGGKVALTGELTIGEYNGKPQYEVRCSDIDCFMSGQQGGNRQNNDSGWTGQTPREPDNGGWNGEGLDDACPF